MRGKVRKKCAVSKNHFFPIYITKPHMATYLEPYLVYIWLCVDVRSRARMCAVVRSREQMCANARRSARMYPDMRSFGENIRLSSQFTFILPNAWAKTKAQQ